MEKKLKLALNKYDPTPDSLRLDPSSNAPVDVITVNLANLFHHYYLDSFGTAPPDPDPTKFEPTHFLLPCDEFRFAGNGYGISPAIRRHRSNELGQALCRQFLYEHLGLTYFAHVEGLLGRQLFRPFPGCRLEREEAGDTPDYLCAGSSVIPYLAEAKGRYSAISFANREFQTWRQQFSRVIFKDASGHPRRVKGHIVATRFATEEDSQRLRSTLFAEDPSSPGRLPLLEDTGAVLVRAIRAQHYSRIATKLRQPLLASALATGIALTSQLRVAAIAWRVVQGPLEGHRFVGGYFGPEGGSAPWQKTDDGFAFDPFAAFRLDSPSFTFFGLEESVFRQVVAQAREGEERDVGVQPFERTEFFYSGFSVLRDGSALGPLEFFVPAERITL